MKIVLSIDEEELGTLPIELRHRIYHALMLNTVVPVPPPAQAVVATTYTTGQSVVLAQPTVVQTPPPEVTKPPVMIKQPQLLGDTKFYAADRGHPTQQNSAVDVMTGQAVQVVAPTAPYMPPVQNAPVSVAPVVTQGAPQPQMVPGVDANFVRSAAIRLNCATELGGRQALDACLARAGIPNMLSVNEQNAGALYQQILSVGGK